MTAEEALADMRAEVANPPWCYVDDGVPFEYIPVEFVNRWIDALTAPQPVELPTHVLLVDYPDGSKVVYFADNVNVLSGLPWNSAVWVPVKPVPCTPPPAPKGTNDASN